jgi:triosephosphate isomerase
MTRKPIIAGNWKMNLNHFEAILLVQKLAASLNEQQLTEVEVALLPPFTDLRSVQTAIDGDKLLFALGAQDLSPKQSGAYTGDISGAMLAKLSCTYVLAGHSERREYHNEDDETVNAKVHAAFRNGLTPIFCVGEGLPVREEGGHVAHCTSRWSSPTSRSGPSAPARPRPPRTPRRCAAPSGRGSPRCTGRRSPTPSGSSTAAP